MFITIIFDTSRYTYSFRWYYGLITIIGLVVIAIAIFIVRRRMGKKGYVEVGGANVN